jgi:hypothetical protein
MPPFERGAFIPPNAVAHSRWRSVLSIRLSQCSDPCLHMWDALRLLQGSATQRQDPPIGSSFRQFLGPMISFPASAGECRENPQTLGTPWSSEKARSPPSGRGVVPGVLAKVGHRLENAAGRGRKRPPKVSNPLKKPKAPGRSREGTGNALENAEAIPRGMIRGPFLCTQSWGTSPPTPQGGQGHFSVMHIEIWWGRALPGADGRGRVAFLIFGVSQIRLCRSAMVRGPRGAAAGKRVSDAGRPPLEARSDLGHAKAQKSGRTRAGHRPLAAEGFESPTKSRAPFNISSPPTPVAPPSGGRRQPRSVPAPWGAWGRQPLHGCMRTKGGMTPRDPGNASAKAREPSAFPGIPKPEAGNRESFGNQTLGNCPLCRRPTARPRLGFSPRGAPQPDCEVLGISPSCSLRRLALSFSRPGHMSARWQRENE